MFNFSEAYAHEQTLLVQKIVGEHNGSDFVFVEDAEAKKELWQVECLDLLKTFDFISFSKVIGRIKFLLLLSNAY